MPEETKKPQATTNCSGRKISAVPPEFEVKPPLSVQAYARQVTVSAVGAYPSCEARSALGSPFVSRLSVAIPPPATLCGSLPAATTLPHRFIFGYAKIIQPFSRFVKGFGKKSRGNFYPPSHGQKQWAHLHALLHRGKALGHQRHFCHEGVGLSPRIVLKQRHEVHRLSHKKSGN